MINSLATGFHFLAARQRLRSLHGQALADFQEKRIQKIIKFAQAKSPFYKNHWKDHDLSDWRRLPETNKQVMMENFSAFNTRQITLEQALQTAQRAENDRNFSPTVQGLTVGLSSGTSGYRGLFLVSPQEQTSWAGIILSRTLHTIPLGKMFAGGLRIAFILRSNSNLYEQTGSKLIHFQYFNLSTILSALIHSLNKFDPQILIAPPRMLYQLAGASASGDLSIKPDRLISVADVLEDNDRKFVQDIFGRPLEQIYQCTEGLIAVTCSQGALHVQEDLVKIQWESLNDDSSSTAIEPRFVPIITDLWRTTQPIIRYRLNDIIRLSPVRCACGSDFQVIEAIEGRSDDILYFNSANGLTAVFPDTIRKAIMLAKTELKEYACTQFRPGHLQVCLSGVKDYAQATQAVGQSIEQVMNQISCRVDQLEFSPDLKDLPSDAKRRRITRMYGK